MLQFFQVALFSYCSVFTLIVFRGELCSFPTFFRVALFSYCIFSALFPCCNFEPSLLTCFLFYFVLVPFFAAAFPHTAHFSYCTFPCCTNFMLHPLPVALSLCCTHATLISCYGLFRLHFFILIFSSFTLSFSCNFFLLYFSRWYFLKASTNSVLIWV